MLDSSLVGCGGGGGGESTPTLPLFDSASLSFLILPRFCSVPFVSFLCHALSARWSGSGLCLWRANSVGGEIRWRKAFHTYRVQQQWRRVVFSSSRRRRKRTRKRSSRTRRLLSQAAWVRFRLPGKRMLDAWIPGPLAEGVASSAP